MFKNKLGEDSLTLKLIHLKIRCQDGVDSLTTLEVGELKVPIDGCIKGTPFKASAHGHGRPLYAEKCFDTEEHLGKS